jgi:hypothetical protein
MTPFPDPRDPSHEAIRAESREGVAHRRPPSAERRPNFAHVRRDAPRAAVVLPFLHHLPPCSASAPAALRPKRRPDGRRVEHPHAPGPMRKLRIPQPLSPIGERRAIPGSKPLLEPPQPCTHILRPRHKRRYDATLLLVRLCTRETLPGYFLHDRPVPYGSLTEGGPLLGYFLPAGPRHADAPSPDPRDPSHEAIRAESRARSAPLAVFDGDGEIPYRVTSLPANGDRPMTPTDGAGPSQP